MKLEVIEIGGSYGLTLPKEALVKLGVQAGDSLCITEMPDGFRITLYDPNFEQQMDVARAIMRKRRNALRALAQ